MEIDVKGLYMTGYIGMVLLNIVGGGCFILILMAYIYSLSVLTAIMFAGGGLIMTALITAAYTTKLRRIYFANEYEAKRQKEYDDVERKFEDLKFEQDN